MSTATTSTLASFQSYVEELSQEKLLISVKLKQARARIEELQYLLDEKEEEIKKLKAALETL